MMDIIRDSIVKTRKKHYCSACSRVFKKGTVMRTQVNTFDGIQTWRECPTCTTLLSEHRDHFSDDNICYGDCVSDSLTRGQTPEDLLNYLNRSKNPTLPEQIEIQINGAYKDDCRKAKAIGAIMPCIDEWKVLNQHRIKLIEDNCTVINGYLKVSEQNKNKSKI